jgi:hypothetical protein
MDKKDMYVGMKVKVFDVNTRRMGQPDGGWDGVVTNIRRTKCTIDYSGSRGGSDSVFDIEYQRVEDRYGHRTFKTLEQADRSARESAARAVLKAHGLHEDFGHVSKLSLEKLEAVAAALEAE